MPVKNADPFLKETIESIVNQTHKDWELIAVNDHSSDKTVEILQHFSEKDERIIVRQNSGSGIIDALSTGESSSKGDWISRMDADDLMEVNKLSKLLSSLSNEREIATSYVKYFSDQDLGEGYKNYELWLNKLIDENNHFDEIYKECVLPSPNWLMHKRLLKELGGFSSLNYPEDYDLCFKAYSNNIKIIGVKEVLHYWRDYPDRTSRTHENYQDNAFLPLKVKYFIELDYDPAKRLILWGAGKKGKKLAQILLKHQIKFDWITDNPKKLDAPIFGKQLLHSDEIGPVSTQAIIAVAGPDDQLEIKGVLKKMPNIEPFWFC